MPNNTLFNLASEYEMLYTALAESADEDGVIDESLLPAVGEAKATLEAKALSVAQVVRYLDEDIDLFDKEITRLTAAKKHLENEQKRVKAYLQTACEKCGIESIKGVHAKISFIKSTSTDIYDESELPDEYFRTKTTVEPDKTKIKDAIKAGIDVPGARLVERRNIQIK